MTGGRKSAEKSAGNSGIKSFFVSKTPQPKSKDGSPQSAKENCIDLSKDDKEAVKPTKAAAGDTNMFFMSRGDRQRAIARQKELQEQEAIRQKEAEELAIAQQREARIQEDMIRARKETSQMLLAKSKSGEEGKNHNPFFLARAPAPLRTASGGASGAAESVADSSEPSEATFPTVQNVGLNNEIEAVQHANRLNPNQFKLRSISDANDISHLVRSASGGDNAYSVVVPDWAVASGSDWSALEFSTSFSPPRGRGGVQADSRAAVGQARMYPLSQAALNLRALWILWVQASLNTDRNTSATTYITTTSTSTSTTSTTTTTATAPALLNSLTASDSEDPKAPGVVLTRWLQDWAAKRRSTADLNTVVASKGRSGINNNNTTPAKARASRSSSVTSSVKGRNGGTAFTNGKVVAKQARGRKRRVCSDSDDDEEVEEVEVSDSEDFNQGSEDEEENENKAENDKEEEQGSEDEWQSSASDSNTEDSDDEPLTRRGRSTSLPSSRHCSRTGSGTGYQRGNRNEQGNGEECDSEELSNVMVLEGPSGSGKSAAVHETARLLGYKVIEVNASHTRNGASIKKLIAEAAQSAHIMDNMGSSSSGGGGSGVKLGGSSSSGGGSGVKLSSANGGASGGTSGASGTSGGTEMNLILFDEVDIAFDDEDHQLYTTIQQLAHISKCPILLTTEQPLPFFKALRAKHVKFSRPSVTTTQALHGLVSNLTTFRTALAKTSNTEGAEVKKAFSMFCGKKESIVDLSAPTTASQNKVNLSDKDLHKLQVLCGLSDGDLRAALSSVQCFADHFLGAKANKTNTSHNTLHNTITLPTSLTNTLTTTTTTPSVVDLTSSPTAMTKKVAPLSPVAEPDIAVSAASELGFGQFLSELKLDFALFESVPRLVKQLLGDVRVNSSVADSSVDSGVDSSVVVATNSLASTHTLYVPVVHDVTPRFGPCAGGFVVTIRGSHFLQYSGGNSGSCDGISDSTSGGSDSSGDSGASSDGTSGGSGTSGSSSGSGSASSDGTSGSGTACVRVTLNSVIECPCVLKDDSTIVAYIPPVTKEGVYIVQVEVSSTTSAGKKLTVSSSVCGVGGAWIQLRKRHFPLIRSTNSLQRINLSQCRVTSVSSASNQNSEGSSSSNGSDEEKRTSCANSNGSGGTSGGVSGNGSISGRLSSGKRLRAESESESEGSGSDEDSTSFADPIAVGSGASASAVDCGGPNKRRRRVIADDDEEEEEDGEVAVESTHNREADVDKRDVDVATTEMPCEEEYNDDEVTSSTAPATATTTTTITTPVADATTLHSLVSKIEEAVRYTLSILRLNGHSEVFLHPVDDEEVPGYSSVIARPMDLGTIEESLNEGLYAIERRIVVNSVTGESVPHTVLDVASLVEDVRLIWSNCIKFNEQGSLYTRHAYMLNFWFEMKLFETLQSSFTDFPGVRVLSADHNGVALFVRVEFNGENVFSVPRCGTFDRCHKLRASFNVARLRRLLLEQQKWPKKEGGGSNDNSGDSGGSSSGGSSGAAAPALAPKFLTAEEALAPELVSTLDLAIATSAAEERRTQLLNGNNTKSLVPGLPVLELGLALGLEYEDDQAAPLYVHSLVRGGAAGELLALAQLSSLHDSFCAADAFTSAALTLGQYGCSESDDDPSDAALRSYSVHNTSISEDVLSYAQCSTSAARLGVYGDCLRGGALRVFTHAVSDSSGGSGNNGGGGSGGGTSADKAAYHTAMAKCTPPISTSDKGLAYLQSAHLQHQLRRTDHVRVLHAAANRYVSSPGNRVGSACAGLIAQHTLRSLCVVPRALAVDVFPLISGMCRTEMSNDEEVQELIRQHSAVLSDTTHNSNVNADTNMSQCEDLNALVRSVSGDRRRTLRLVSNSAYTAMNAIDGGRRSSRRGNNNNDNTGQPRKHKCFATMKAALSVADEKLLRQLAASSDLFSVVS